MSTPKFKVVLHVSEDDIDFARSVVDEMIKSATNDRAEYPIELITIEEIEEASPE